MFNRCTLFSKNHKGPGYMIDINRAKPFVVICQSTSSDLLETVLLSALFFSSLFSPICQITSVVITKEIGSIVWEKPWSYQKKKKSREGKQQWAKGEGKVDGEQGF